MTISEAIKLRHSVRNYKETPIDNKIIQILQKEIDACNRESGLHIQLVTNEDKAFSGMMAHYGKFSGVRNYIALIGKKSSSLDEQIGYYGERIALFAQTLGLNTCWVALTFSKGATKSNCQMEHGEKIVCVLSLGYGETQGVAHKSKSMNHLCKADNPMPDWFHSGMEAALLAPTAMNQQKFLLTQTANTINAEATGGFYSKVDLGIVKYHFEIGAGKENFQWKD